MFLSFSDILQNFIENLSLPSSKQKFLNGAYFLEAIFFSQLTMKMFDAEIWLLTFEKKTFSFIL